MSARTALGPGLCLLGGFLCLTGVSCFLMKTYTPEDTRTRFTSDARTEKVLDAAVNVLEANGFVVKKRSRTRLAALQDTRETLGTTMSTTQCRGGTCTGVGSGSEASNSNVQTIVHVTLTPHPDHTDVVVSLEKRNSKLYSSDVKLSRKIAKLLEEALAEKAG